MANIFRWGVIGPGRIAERFAESIACIDHAKIQAVASRELHRATVFANRYNIDLAFEGYEKLFDSSLVDAIYIATPINFHFKQVRSCLEAGIPVLCEKSFTINAKEAQYLFDYSNKNNVFLMEAMWTPFLPIYRDVESWLESGVIGEIKHIQSSFGFAIPRILNGRELNHDLGGGVLLEMGVYNVAISQWVMRKSPSSISATGYVGETNVDESVAVNIEYGDGVVSQFMCSYQAELSNDFVISGTKGKIKIHPFFWDNGYATLKIGDEETRVKRNFRGRGFEYQIEHVMQCVTENRFESPVMSHRTTLENMSIMDEIRRQIGFAYRYENENV